MPQELKKIDHESAHQYALSLFTNEQIPDIEHNVSLPLNSPYVLNYSTKRYFEGAKNISYGRLALVNPNEDLPEIGDNQDALQTSVGTQEIGLRDFVMEHNFHDLITKVYSGLHVRKEYTNLGIGGLLIGLSNHVIEDMILRFLAGQYDMKVQAYMIDGAHSNGTGFNRNGWTSHQAERLGFKALPQQGDYLPSFLKEYEVKQLLTAYSKN